MEHIEIKELPLTEKDRKKLKQKFLPMGLFLVFAVAIFSFIYTQILKGSSDNFIMIPTIMFGLFGLIFFGIIIFMFRSIALDLKNGTKKQITGRVTDKRMNVQTSTSNRSTGRGGSRSSTSKHYSYYIYLDGKEYTVDYPNYSKVKSNDLIKMERTAISNAVLNIEILESTAPVASKEVRNTHSIANFNSKELPLNDKDYDALKANFRAKLKTRLIYIGFIAFFVIPFLANIQLIFMLFISPLLFVGVFQILKIGKAYLNYTKNKNSGMKKCLKMVINDKVAHTGNRRKNTQNLITNIGNLRVPSELYDKVKTGDSIISFAPIMDAKDVFSVMTDDNEVYYL